LQAAGHETLGCGIADELFSLKDRISELEAELDKARQLVSDEQIEAIHSEIYSIYSEEEITYDDFAKIIRSILERK